MINNLPGNDEASAERPNDKGGVNKGQGFLSDSDVGFGRDERQSRAASFVLSDAPPESFAETARKSGLAWSAGIVFFGSVVFTMALGWLVDVVLGSSPWGIVGGIILGSLVGFIQFFRIASQIFKR